MLTKTLNNLVITILLTGILATGCQPNSQDQQSQTTNTPTPNLSEHFKYKADGSIIVSGHRGGRISNLPENSLAIFYHISEKMPVFFEIDPRLTKDSVIVLLHDNTLDRTTNGSGKLANYTFDELKDIRLKDHEGNITPYKIPTLREAIEWSRNKVILNLDKKDVPLHMIANLIEELNAEDHIMVTVHTGAQARYYYDRFPGIMLSAFARTKKEYEDLTYSGVPWHNMIAYVGRTINEENKKTVEQLRANGVRCMVSYAPTFDKLPTPEERAIAYQKEITTKPDIIESDYPLEVWSVIETAQINKQ